MWKKIHPDSAILNSPNPSINACSGNHRPTLPAADPTTLIVWRKSLLFNCDGFTVFDSTGNLVYRVDNYPKCKNQGEIVLMDAAGKPLLTIRRKVEILSESLLDVQTKLILGQYWGIYAGETRSAPRFSARKQMSFFRSRTLARLTTSSVAVAVGEGYEVEGCYKQRRCAVFDERRREMAEIRQKEAVGGAAFGLDVFRLVVQPSFDAAVAMAVVVLLEGMIGSKSSPIKG
ncbi:Protein LURP-one-related 8 [Platanthera guangdongensis]|uniref:Protein LURP-one-related 8 n=1 Tax=Platanthera guangdongensis TaxID=2320717 RepID=A0ABR2MCP4_9ASPA